MTKELLQTIKLPTELERLLIECAICVPDCCELNAYFPDAQRIPNFVANYGEESLIAAKNQLKQLLQEIHNRGYSVGIEINGEEYLLPTKEWCETISSWVKALDGEES